MLTPRSRLGHFVRSYGLLFICDVIAWAFAILAALILRFDFSLGRIHWGWTLALIGVTALLQLIGGWVFWLYRGRYETGGFDEVRALALEVTTVTIVASAAASAAAGVDAIATSVKIAAKPATNPAKAKAKAKVTTPMRTAAKLRAMNVARMAKHRASVAAVVAAGVVAVVAAKAKAPRAATKPLRMAPTR